MVFDDCLNSDFSQNPMKKSKDNPSNELIPVCPSRIPCKLVKLCPASKIPRWNLVDIQKWNVSHTQQKIYTFLDSSYSSQGDTPLNIYRIYDDLRVSRNKKPNVAQGRAPMARFMPGVLGSSLGMSNSAIDALATGGLYFRGIYTYMFLVVREVYWGWHWSNLDELAEVAAEEITPFLFLIGCFVPRLGESG